MKKQIQIDAVLFFIMTFFQVVKRLKAFLKLEWESEFFIVLAVIALLIYIISRVGKNNLSSELRIIYIN